MRFTNVGVRNREDKQEMIDIIETIYKGAKKGRGLVISPKDYSTRYRY
jgi:DIM1 family U5 snRNP protein